MAISTPGDIVLDVARAAEPAKLESARARLMQFAEGGAATAPFDVGASQETGRAQAGRTAPAAPSDAPPDAFVKFEAMVLQTFIQSMLPEDAEAVYGEGMAGDMWKSIMSEKIGESMAERGGIGIAERVLGDRYADGDQKVALRGLPDTQGERAPMNASMSSPMVDEIERNIAQTLAANGALAQSDPDRD